MPIPASYWSQTINDNTLKSNGQPESTNFRVPITTLTPANVAATVTLTGNLAAAFAGIIIGEFAANETTYARNILSGDPAASQLAQRENKWLFRYHDATVPSQKHTVSLGTADLTVLPNNSEFIDLTAGAGLAVKTAFEAVVVAPNDSAHSVILDSIQFVGRNT